MKIEIEIDPTLLKGVEYFNNLYGSSHKSFILTAMRTQAVLMSAYSLGEIAELVSIAAAKAVEHRHKNEPTES